ANHGLYFALIDQRHQSFHAGPVQVLRRLAAVHDQLDDFGPLRNCHGPNLSFLGFERNTVGPNLVTVKRAGKLFDADAQVTKIGNTLLLDRLTGKPLFPFRWRRATASSLPESEPRPTSRPRSFRNPLRARISNAKTW